MKVVQISTPLYMSLTHDRAHRKFNELKQYYADFKSTMSVMERMKYELKLLQLDNKLEDIQNQIDSNLVRVQYN